MKLDELKTKVLENLRRIVQRSSPISGVDTGSQSYKVAVIREQGGHPVIQEKIYLDFNNREQAKSVFKKCTKSAALALADDKIEAREFHLPTMDKTELDTAVDWELKQNISSEGVFRDVVGFLGSNGWEMSCLLAPHDVVRARHDEAIALGLQPKFLETESSALLSCLQLIHAEATGPRIVIDMGWSSFRVHFFHQSRSLFTRALYFGLSSFFDQVADQTKTSKETLVPLFQAVGVNTQEISKDEVQGVLIRLYQELLYTLSEELRRSEAYVREEKSLKEVKEIYLCGGGACVRGVAEYMNSHLAGKEVRLLDPFKEIFKDTSVESGPVWAMAVGLALGRGV